eukprot:CAMPEP_0176148048 /NCGR_PEP_ID=MMETSP0120_2-20121206/75489_1 /TAXON_ID=160619 /ORGANISM="Kryptoperidinium foliaceum, Strain CCMP 1326" /LENGTH=52 /DNA_ID=CAMNT_0017484711 /DNA_START=1 /DNA_END=159 /DNA_ORIENTATION=+
MDFAAAGGLPSLAALLRSSQADVKKRATMLRDTLLKDGGRGVRAAMESAKAI